MVCAGDLQQGYGSSSQDISSKRASPGLLIGCTIDTSTGVLSFVSVLVVRTVTWCVRVTYSSDTAVVARISHQTCLTRIAHWLYHRYFYRCIIFCFSVGRKNCYMVCAGDLQQRYSSSSQDISSKHASPGLLIGCTIDTSTGVFLFQCWS